MKKWPAFYQAPILEVPTTKSHPLRSAKIETSRFQPLTAVSECSNGPKLRLKTSICWRDFRNPSHLTTFTTGSKTEKSKQIVSFKFASTRQVYLSRKNAKNPTARAGPASIQLSPTEPYLNCTSSQSEKTLMTATHKLWMDWTLKKTSRVIIYQKYKVLRPWLMRNSWNLDKAIWPTTSLVTQTSSLQTAREVTHQMANDTPHQTINFSQLRLTKLRVKSPTCLLMPKKPVSQSVQAICKLKAVGNQLQLW